MQQQMIEMWLALLNNVASRFLWFMHQTLGVWRWFPKSQAAFLNTYGETWTNINVMCTPYVLRSLSCPRFLTGLLPGYWKINSWFNIDFILFCSNSAMSWESSEKVRRISSFQENFTTKFCFWFIST